MRALAAEPIIVDFASGGSGQTFQMIRSTYCPGCADLPLTKPIPYPETCPPIRLHFLHDPLFLHDHVHHAHHVHHVHHVHLRSLTFQYLLNHLHPDSSTILSAEVPLAEMFGYATAIRSLSKGRAAYSMEPFRFEPVPNSIVAGILDTAKGKPAARA